MTHERYVTSIRPSHAMGKKIEPLPLYSAEKKVVVSLWNGNGTEDKSSM